MAQAAHTPHKDDDAQAPAVRAGASVTEQVFEVLLGRILSGAYPSGERLPAERVLSERLGASRSAVREALRRLGAWRVVEARRGSGVVVLDRWSWSIEVLPAYVHYMLHTPQAWEGGELVSAELLGELLGVRRTVLAQVVGVVAGRATPEGLARCRAALEVAAAADSPEAFVVADLGLVRAVVGAAEMLPAVWLLNALSGVYVQLAGALTRVSAHALPPHGYRACYEALFEALEDGARERAMAIMSAYLEGHDAALLRAWEVWR